MKKTERISSWIVPSPKLQPVSYLLLEPFLIPAPEATMSWCRSFF